MRALMSPPRLPLRPLLAAGLVMAVLLLLLGIVLRQSVREAAGRNAGNAARADALWRCQLGRDHLGRQDCVQQALNSLAVPR
jgi:uncharacterized membrane protein